MTIPTLSDEDVRPLLDMGELIALMETFLLAEAAGAAVAPARHAVTFGPDGKLVFTIGGLRHQGRSVSGFRAYHTCETTARLDNAQIVAVWESGALSGLILGRLLGEWRTGALGGVAVKHMSRADAKICAVIGTGRQARTQLLAVSACRALTEVRVYGRSEENRKQFASDLAAETKFDVRAAGTAREAVEGADIVLCATNSATPVLETAWLAPGAHVNAVGPKTQGAHELPVDIAARVSLIATDSVRQLNDSGAPGFLAAEPVWSRLQDLAGLVTAQIAPPRLHGDISLFCSAGLAGTEVLAGAHILQRYLQRYRMAMRPGP